MLDNGQMVETLLDEKTNDAIRVKDEVSALSVFVSDHSQQGNKLWGLVQDMNIWERDCRGNCRLWLAAFGEILGSNRLLGKRRL